MRETRSPNGPVYKADAFPAFNCSSGCETQSFFNLSYQLAKLGSFTITMKLSQAYFLLSIAPAWALPASQGPPGASGSLRGSESLLGSDPARPEPSVDSTVIPSDQYELAPGQSGNGKEGLYIDLSKVKNPQPIQNGGATDPGPR